MSASPGHWTVPESIKGKKIIAAVSGGLDSMVLAYWLRQAGVAFVVAHCNFSLRGEESDGDQAFVEQWAMQHGVPYYTTRFDMPGITREGGNTQDVARRLRYNWFEELRASLQFDLVATAHHKQDSVETMLLNFFKGTGIAGMHGILTLQGKIVRPLLSFSKDEIREYAVSHNIAWREDSSNRKTDYTRNAIRHRLIPLLEELFPNVVNNLAGNTARFSEAETLYREAVSKHLPGLMEQRQQEWYIPVRKLKQQPAFRTLLWEMLQPFRFSARQMPDVCRLLDAESGRYVASGTHRIIRNRDFLILTSLREAESAFILIERADTEAVFGGRKLTLRTETLEPDSLEAIRKLSANEICIDSEALRFPLILRPWRQGDYFYPLGTQPKKKKISKYLIEQKVPVHEKEKVWVLESDRRIVWVVGYRPDDRFRVQPHSVNGIRISVKDLAENEPNTPGGI